MLAPAQVARSSAEPSLAKMLSRDTPLPPTVGAASRFRGPRAWKGQMLILLFLALALIAGALTFAEIAFPAGPVAAPPGLPGGQDGSASGWDFTARDFTAEDFTAVSGPGGVSSRGLGDAQRAGDTARQATSFLLG
jgi:hypothetical protein